MASALRKSLVAAAAAALVLALHGGPSRAAHSDAAACRTAAACLVALPDVASLVATKDGGPLDAALEPVGARDVALVTVTGRQRWRVATTSAVPPRLAAAGDVDRDGITDFILWLVNPVAPPEGCGGLAVQVSSLLLVDGRTGRSSSPFPALRDICWDTPAFNYPTQQWDFGSVYIGDFAPAEPGREVVLVPYYAKEGTVWSRRPSGAWSVVRHGTLAAFPYPSTSDFDRVYDASNPTPCSRPLPGGTCFVENSHVANAIFLGGRGGLFLLTSARAVVYRPDLTPTSDTTWFPGSHTDNAGRNYGLLVSYGAGGRQYADLIGGCSVVTMWHAIRTGAPGGGDDNCGLVHHLERFALDGTAITRHVGRFYGYFGTTGPLEGRVEYPAHPHGALGGAGTSWTAFNVFTGGSWSMHVFKGSLTTDPVVVRGWFVWDMIGVGGKTELLASRAPSGRAIVPPSLDVLRWDGRGVRSVQHVAGVVPALLRSPPTPRVHTLEDGVYTSYVLARRGAAPALLVTARSGARRFVTLAR